MNEKCSTFKGQTWGVEPWEWAYHMFQVFSSVLQIDDQDKEMKEDPGATWRLHLKNSEASFVLKR